MSILCQALAVKKAIHISVGVHIAEMRREVANAYQLLDRRPDRPAVDMTAKSKRQRQGLHIFWVEGTIGWKMSQV